MVVQQSGNHPPIRQRRTSLATAVAFAAAAFLVGACTNGIADEDASRRSEAESTTSTATTRSGSRGEPSNTSTDGPESEIPVNPGQTPGEVIEETLDSIAEDTGISIPDVSFPDVSLPDLDVPDFTIPDLTTPDGTPITIPDFDQQCLDNAEAFANLTIQGFDGGSEYDQAKAELEDSLPQELQDELSTIVGAYDKLHEEGFLGAADALASDEFTTAITDMSQWLSGGCKG